MDRVELDRGGRESLGAHPGAGRPELRAPRRPARRPAEPRSGAAGRVAAQRGAGRARAGLASSRDARDAAPRPRR
ncbi:MAG: hypothetical protein AVDCRST_MAG45-1750 [uncultured Solirubrobacterales bacterium]|uniref:Uncharacterized protein n=1 Tax=uncultured Solirubrobacterales bacterium TaxID=768556 RepID=A0A6J4SY18_9ACTN|nr:MAG: hypothetical protein AVDCRST_MAG45-1750 [uncultured Solirubrobacterales bacterium]